MRTMTSRGLQGPERFPVEAELVHDPGREVLDQQVRRAEQSMEQRRDPSAELEVESHAALGEVDGVEDRDPTPTTRPLAVPADAREPHLIRPGHRLDLDHVGTERGEDVRGGRPSPPGGAIDHLDRLKREFALAVRSQRRGRPAVHVPTDRTVVSPRVRRAGERRPGRTARDPVRDSRLGEAPGGGAARRRPGRRSARSASTPGASRTGAAGMRKARPPRAAPPMCGCACTPGRRRGTRRGRAKRLATWASSGSSSRSGRSMMTRKSWNCWALLAVKTKQPSLVGSIDGSWMLRPVPTSGGPPEERREDRGVGDQRDRHAVEDGHVDVLARPERRASRAAARAASAA